MAFVILYSSFIKKMENRLASLTLHPRERLPQIAPRINLEPGRFFISVEEFNGRIEEISRDLGKVKAFSTFAIIIMIKSDSGDLWVATSNYFLNF